MGRNTDKQKTIMFNRSQHQTPLGQILPGEQSVRPKHFLVWHLVWFIAFVCFLTGRGQLLHVHLCGVYLLICMFCRVAQSGSTLLRICHRSQCDPGISGKFGVILSRSTTLSCVKIILSRYEKIPGPVGRPECLVAAV